MNILLWIYLQGGEFCIIVRNKISYRYINYWLSAEMDRGASNSGVFSSKSISGSPELLYSQRGRSSLLFISFNCHVNSNGEIWQRLTNLFGVRFEFVLQASLHLTNVTSCVKFWVSGSFTQNTILKKKFINAISMSTSGASSVAKDCK